MNVAALEILENQGNQADLLLIKSEITALVGIGVKSRPDSDTISDACPFSRYFIKNRLDRH
jgi:hypothetical protein